MLVKQANEQRKQNTMKNGPKQALYLLLLFQPGFFAVAAVAAVAAVVAVVAVGFVTVVAVGLTGQLDLLLHLQITANDRFMNTI